MESFCLEFDHYLSSLEQSKRWKTAAEYVVQKWKDQPDNLNSLICAGTQLWYTRLLMEYYQHDPFPTPYYEDVPASWLESELVLVTHYGFIHFGKSAKFNMYFGYMISITPYFFLDYAGDYIGWKENGIRMMEYAFNLVPDNLCAKAIYYSANPFVNNECFAESCQQLWEALTPTQWGYSEVQQYFFRILKGNVYHQPVTEWGQGDGSVVPSGQGTEAYLDHNSK